MILEIIYVVIDTMTGLVLVNSMLVSGCNRLSFYVRYLGCFSESR